jgi:predicted secreted protein
MSNEVHGYGTQLQVDNGSGVFVSVLNVKSIGGPKMSANVVDITNFLSSGGWREKLTTLLDGGEITFGCNFVPTEGTHDQSTGVIALFKNRTTRTWKIIFADTGLSKWEFDASISGLDFNDPLEGVWECNVTLVISGEPTF